MGHSAFGYSLDICNQKQVEKTFSTIFSNHSHIDCLINGAAFAMKNMQDGGDDFFRPLKIIHYLIVT